MLMMDDGIIRDASFSFKAMQKNYLNIKGRKVRELKEVLHGETTVVYGIDPVNPLAGVQSVTKAHTLENVLQEFKSYVDRMESFVRNTKASDETIIAVMDEVKTARSFLSSFDTANTQQITEPVASSEDNNRDAFKKQLLLLTANMS